MVAGDVHATAEAGEINVDCGFLAVAAKDDGIGLHIVLKILALELGETRLDVAAAAASHLGGFATSELLRLGFRSGRTQR